MSATNRAAAIGVLSAVDVFLRLEELQHVTRLLIDDVVMLRPKLGEMKPDPTLEEAANRRFYIRAVFALAEAFVEQHRLLLLELCAARRIELSKNTRKKLSEIREVLGDDGELVVKKQYLQIFEKIKEVYKAAACGFEQKLTVTFGDVRWTNFKAAMEVRDRITHPKKVEDCWIFDDALRSVTDAYDWFRLLQNEFVRMARKHRTEHGW